MNVRMYSIYDTKGLIYAPPFLAHTDGIAIRMLQELVDANDTTVGRHPADFRLYCVGVFEDRSGSIENYQPPDHVIDAVALVKLAPMPLFQEAAQ